MTTPVQHLRKQDIAHLLRAAAAVTRCSVFVMVGTGAVIARVPRLPLDLMLTREIDIFPLGPDDPESMSTLIDGTIGEGSQFDVTFGYYAHGVGERTACLPDDWRHRAAELELPPAEKTICLCPDADDIGLANACAWRENDRVWLRSAVVNGIVAVQTMTARAPLITNPNAPATPEIVRRLGTLQAPPAAQAGDKATSRPS